MNTPLNHQLLRGDEVGIFRVLRLQIRFAVLDHVGLERALPVHECGDDLTMARVWSPLQNHQIPIENMAADHGNPANAHRKRVPSRRESDAANVHRDATFRLWFAASGKPAGMAPRTGMSTMRLRSFGQRGDHPERPRLAGIRGEITFLPHQSEVAGHRIHAAKTEMIRDFLIRWRAAVLPAMTFNEVGQRPLFGSEWLHTVWIHTITISVRVNDILLR